LAVIGTIASNDQKIAPRAPSGLAYPILIYPGRIGMAPAGNAAARGFRAAPVRYRGTALKSL
jgi:hypothetical protein